MAGVTRAAAWVALALAAELCSAAPAAAQTAGDAAADGAQARRVRAGALLPEHRYMRVPLADPTAPRISVALLSTDLLSAPGPERPPFQLPNRQAAAQEVVAAVGIGAVFPLLQLATWDGGGALLAVDGRVFGRFRVELPRRDDMGQDWYVGGIIEAAHRRLSSRFGIMHRSSHLGDEFMAATQAERIEFGGEEVELQVAYDVPAIARVYAGGSWIFRSYLGWEARLRELGVRDRGRVQAGFEREWQPWADPRFVLLAGVDYSAAQRTGWHPTFAGAAGLGVRGARSLRLVVRGFDGRSQLGQFFLTRERYFSLELGAQF